MSALICNFDDLLEHFDNNKELLQKIYAKYRTNSQELIQDLKTAIEQNNQEKVSVIAHTLKGSTSNFFAEDLVGKLQELENKATQFTSDECHVYLNDINKLLSELIDFLDEKVA